jgi:hypothetical protein
MNEHKGFLVDLAETVERHLPRRVGSEEGMTELRHSNWRRALVRLLVPNVGTLLLVVVLLLTVPSLAAPLQAPSATSTSTISYQGRLADSAGNPLTDKYNMEFRIYDIPTGGTPLWTEMWTGGNAVDVSDGLFNVMLGSIDNTLASSIDGYDELYLGITVGTDSEMVPRVQLGSVPFSMQAMTVPDGSVTTEKIADEAVTQAKLGPDVSVEPPAGSITTTMIADGAVTQVKAPELLKSVHRQDRIVDTLSQTDQYLAKGWGCWGPTNGTATTYVKSVTFPVTYDDVPIIVLSIAGDFVDFGSPPTSHGGTSMDMFYKPIVAPLSQGPTGFSANLVTNPTYPAGHYACFTWMAIGTLAN